MHEPSLHLAILCSVVKLRAPDQSHQTLHSQVPEAPEINQRSEVAGSSVCPVVSSGISEVEHRSQVFSLYSRKQNLFQLYFEYNMNILSLELKTTCTLQRPVLVWLGPNRHSSPDEGPRILRNKDKGKKHQQRPAKGKRMKSSVVLWQFWPTRPQARNGNTQLNWSSSCPQVGKVV